MNLLIPRRIGNPPTVLTRLGWATGAAPLIAFAVFEMGKHQGWAIALGIVGAVAPDLALVIGLKDKTEPGQLSPRAVVFYNLAHLWVLPVLVLLWYGLNSQTNDQAAPGFTLGLAWLAHICADRAFGFGPRNREGWQRYRRESSA